MNERIRELADQALKECDAAKERGIDQYSKRFAELIVRECIEHLEGNVAVPNLEQSRTKAKCISSIKEHFGINDE